MQLFMAGLGVGWLTCTGYFFLAMRAKFRELDVRNENVKRELAALMALAAEGRQIMAAGQAMNERRALREWRHPGDATSSRAN
jgi:uncharacterized membrane protein YciS (DUF1049 family)